MKKKLWLGGKIVIALAAVYFVVATAYFSHREDVLQLISLPLLLCLLIATLASLISIFSRWREYGARAALPFLACVLSFIGSMAVATVIHNLLFDWSLPSYEAAVQQIQSGRIPVSTNYVSLQQFVPQARLTYMVWARRDTNGDLFVDFVTERGFPVLHSGYLYSSSGKIEPGSQEDSRWPIRSKKRPQWFYVSD